MASLPDDGPAFRYGAPAAVVDPLLSFLFDLRRLEETVLSALEHMGVQRRLLPAPFGGDSGCPAASASPATEPGAGGPPASGPGAADAGAASATPAPQSPFERYVRSAVAQTTGPGTAADCTAAVHHLLAWLDTQAPAASSSPLPDSAAARCLLAAFAASGDSHDAFITEAATSAETHVRRHRQKRPRVEESNGQTFTAHATPGSQESSTEQPACHVASLTEADMRAAVLQCRRYERLLRSGTRDLAATLRAVTTADLAESYSCHAKWVEVARADAKVACALPSSEALKRNYEELLCVNDAFATCQAALHSAYVTMEECADVFLEEAQVVAQAERTFQQHTAAAQVECDGLRELRRRLKGTRRAIEASLR